MTPARVPGHGPPESRMLHVVSRRGISHLRALAWGGAFALSAVPGCTSDATTETDTDVVTETDTDTTTETTLIDSAWPPGDIGNLQIAHHVATGRTQVYGLFAKSAPAFVNLAQCAVAETVCVGGFANDEDDWELVDPNVEIDREVVETRFAGFEVRFGTYQLAYREDREYGFGFYSADVTSEDLVQGWVGASWDGQWGHYTSNDDLFVSRPIELQTPRPGAHVFLTNGEFLPIEWVPTGTGTVTLTVSARLGDVRMYHLEDDGYFELDVDDLQIPDDTEDLSMSLMRWDTQSVNFQGNVMQLVASSDVQFTADYANIGPREPLFAADRCDEARGLPSVSDGGYWGRLDFKSPDLNPTSCLLPGSPDANALGKDALVRVEVPSKTMLNVDYNTFTESAAVYILSDCSQASSCLAGSDIDRSPNVHEVTNWFNDSEDPKEVYVGLDCTGLDLSNFPTPCDTVWTLDLTLQTLSDPEMFDECLDARGAQQTLATGGYLEEFVAYTDGLNPGVGGCTGTSMTGADAIMPFALDPGQTISANVTSNDGDVGVYVLSNCNDAFSCVAGSDTSSNATENVVYVNQTLGRQDLFLVVDSKGPGLRPFAMGVSIQ